jgi:hypothetical protein
LGRHKKAKEKRINQLCKEKRREALVRFGYTHVGYIKVFGSIIAYVYECKICEDLVWSTWKESLPLLCSCNREEILRSCNRRKKFLRKLLDIRERVKKKMS